MNKQHDFFVGASLRKIVFFFQNLFYLLAGVAALRVKISALASKTDKTAVTTSHEEKLQTSHHQSWKSENTLQFFLH